MKKFLILLVLISVSGGFAQVNDQKWRAATEKELKALIASSVFWMACAAVTTVQVKLAGERSRLPAASRART